MMRMKQLVINGLFLTASRPIHPLLLKYLSERGCNIRIEDGYIVIEGKYSLPDRKSLLAELIILSKEDNNNEVIFDIDIQSSKLGGNYFEVVNKKTDTVEKISSIPFENYDQEIIDLLFTLYLLLNDAVVYLDENKKLCYLSGDGPIDQNNLILNAKEFIINTIADTQIQKKDAQSNSTESFKDNLQSIPINPHIYALLAIKYGIVNNYQIALINGELIYTRGNLEGHNPFNEKLDKFIDAEYIILQNKGIINTHPKVDIEYSQEQDTEEVDSEPSPGILTSFSNWIFGSTNEELQPKNTQPPKPRL